MLPGQIYPRRIKDLLAERSVASAPFGEPIPENGPPSSKSSLDGGMTGSDGSRTSTLARARGGNLVLPLD